MITRSQKSTSLIYRLLLNTYIAIIKKFINFATSSFNISNKNVPKKIRRKIRRKFQTYYRLLF